jgi:hypothetical protein
MPTAIEQAARGRQRWYHGAIGRPTAAELEEVAPMRSTKESLHHFSVDVLDAGEKARPGDVAE